jgi:hypothetical protein
MPISLGNQEPVYFRTSPAILVLKNAKSVAEILALHHRDVIHSHNKCKKPCEFRIFPPTERLTPHDPLTSIATSRIRFTAWGV